MTGTRFLPRTFRPCRRTRRSSRETTHEDCFDFFALSAGADVYGLWAERVPSLYPPAATGESRGNPVPCCGQRIALRRVLLRAAGAWRTAAILRLFRATCADTACCGALQHPRVPPDDGTGHHRARVGRLRVVDSGLSSVPRKFQGHLQREACEAGIKLLRSRRDTVSPCCEVRNRVSIAAIRTRYVPVRTRSGKAPPGDFGDEAMLVGGHCLIHHVLRKLLRLLGRFGHVARPMNTQSGILCDPASLVLYGRCQASSRPHARSRKGESRRTLSEPFSPFESKLVQSTHARNTLERNCARLAVAHLGPLKRRTGSAISAA